ncbi:MAG: phosphotransferase enzyme family protein [Ktedonobacterales bacterium]
MADQVVMLEDNAIEVMSYWGLNPGNWRVIGFITTGLEQVSRPIIEIGGQQYVLRRQPQDLTENDTLYRHTFMRYLAAQGLPVPPLLQRPEGHTYAVVEDGIYELQGWLDGQRLVTDGPAYQDRIEAAAATLGQLHQASADFRWEPHLWPLERSSAAIAQAYCNLIKERSEGTALTPAIRAGLARVAEVCAERLDTAVDALEAQPRPPELHIHGDYHAHNLAFDGSSVSAIYDFDASHWQRRIDEVGYSLLYFAGVRWDDGEGVTPPLVDDGLDILSANRYLTAYGREAPPAEGEARLLGDALTLAFPAVFANGIAEDLIFPDDFDGTPNEEEALGRLQWADTFWLWLDRYRDVLAQVWENA